MVYLRCCAAWDALRNTRRKIAIVAFGGALLSSHLCADSVMVVVAHPDDETLICAGVVRSAVSRGNSVKVVVLTNGDSHGVQGGLARQQETVAGMGIAGLGEENLIFLGYPNYMEGGLATIWNNHVSADGPAYRSSPTGRDHTYGEAGLGGSDFHTHCWGEAAPYTRESLLGDLADVLERYRPGTLYVHSYVDQHPDHRYTYHAVREAIRIVQLRDSRFRPLVRMAPLHAARDYPFTDFWQSYEYPTLTQPFFGTDASWPWPPFVGEEDDPAAMTARFTPWTAFNEPHYLYRSPLRWADRVSITVPSEMGTTTFSANMKFRMIEAYPSQIGGSGFIYAFGKSDEVFWEQNWGRNAALSAELIASSSSDSLLTGPRNVVDGIPDGVRENGYGNAQAEWVSQGEREGAVLGFSWDTPCEINEVVLWDRPNSTDNVVSGRLVMSDGTEVAFGALPDSADEGLRVPFSARTISWLEVVVDSVSESTGAVGFSEVEVRRPSSLPANRCPYFIAGPGSAGYVAPAGATVELQAQARDPESDSLEWVWSAQKGTFISHGPEAGYMAPDSPGETDLITVTVDDGHGVPVRAQVAVQIVDGVGEFRVLCSLNSNRSPSEPLADATVVGNIYVFVDPDGLSMRQVSFYLDDADMSSAPIQTERAAPYDMAGTRQDGAANAYDSTRLSSGEHTLTVRALLWTGETIVQSVSFHVGTVTVDNPFRVALTPDRCDSVPLEGQLVPEVCYIHVQPERPVASVTFYLDNPNMIGTPHQVERASPYDFAGTAADGRAEPFATTGLQPGEHTVQCLCQWVDGGTAQYETTFEVAAGVPELALKWSVSPSRIPASALDGAVFAGGNVYILLSSDESLQSVQFYLDDPDMAGEPISVDTVSPFDFVGTGEDGAAVPFDTSTLAEGQHGVVALVTYPNGDETVVAAGFSIVVSSGTSDLAYSLLPTRAGDSPLSGAVVQGTIYVFWPEEPGIQSAAFYLDDPGMTGQPSQVEGLRPYDFAGTLENGLAKPFSTLGLDNGEHDISVRVSYSDGRVATGQATFVVTNVVAVPELMVSTQPDRSQAVPLDGEVVLGEVFIFWPDSGGVRRVSFYLDDPIMLAGAYQVENLPPWDCRGTGDDGTGWPLDAAGLGQGGHTMTVRVEALDGSAQTHTSGFQVSE